MLLSSPQTHIHSCVRSRNEATCAKRDSAPPFIRRIRTSDRSVVAIVVVLGMGLARDIESWGIGQGSRGDEKGGVELYRVTFVSTCKRYMPSPWRSFSISSSCMPDTCCYTSRELCVCPIALLTPYLPVRPPGRLESSRRAERGDSKRSERRMHELRTATGTCTHQKFVASKARGRS